MPKIINGQKRMSEEDMLIPALKIINSTVNCTMSDIKKNISKMMKFFPADLEPSPTRPGECKYHQIIGNLRSHIDNNEFGKYVKVESVIINGRHQDIFVLKIEGKKFLYELDSQEVMEAIDEYAENEKVQSALWYADDTDLSSLNNRIPQIGGGVRNNRFKTDSRLSKTVLRRCNYKCEYATLTNCEHITFTSKSNLPYLEAHHLIPMKAQKDYLGVNLDRAENIIGLCPLCHSIVHYGNFDEKEKVLRKLYDNRINLLKNSDQPINISFEELINKYY